MHLQSLIERQSRNVEVDNVYLEEIKRNIHWYLKWVYVQVIS